MTKVKLPTFECLRCGHVWHPKKEEMPTCCGFCKSPYWNKSADAESRAKERHGLECVSCKSNGNS